MLYVISDNL